jgi:pyridoxamine 5'-phosphate oxidase
MSLLSTIRALLILGKGVKRGLSEEDAGTDPLALFDDWYRAARRAGLFLPESMVLATATADGAPSARTMLLKGFDERGFRFFTNYESRKSEELEDNDRAALVFTWGVLQRQVRLQGRVERLSEEESREYFATRPRGSQLGAWASQQSSAVPDRETLDAQFKECEERFRGSEVPLPPFWGGYRLIPHTIEFWQGRANRLHDRFRFVREAGGWKVSRLSP